ncbi:MAG: 3-oxoacyl-ACP synthase III family protein [Candidatus Anammoxibacter sp.]
MLKTKSTDSVSGHSASDHLGAQPFLCATEISCIAHWAPEEVVTSEYLMEQVVSAGRTFPFDLTSLTGIKERRRVPKDMDVIDLALRSATPCLEQSGLRPEDIDLVIFSSVSRKYVEPATAVVLSGRLGIKRSNAFDVSNACLGFMDAFLIADSMIACRRVKNALIITAEIGSKYLDKALSEIQNGGNSQSLFAGLTLGDGTATALITAKGLKPGSIRHVAAIRESYSEYKDLCVIDRQDGLLRTEASKLFKAAVSSFVPLLHKVLDSIGWDVKDVDVVIPHQASWKVVKQGAISSGLLLDASHVTLDYFGNMASASLPFTLSDALKKGKIVTGSKIVFLGFGSGLGVSVHCCEM